MSRRVDEGKPIRLRPRRAPRIPNDNPKKLLRGLAAIQRLARLARVQKIRRVAGGGGRSAAQWKQRVAVRVSYSNNKSSGQWKAHGRYLARESATEGQNGKHSGFTASEEHVNLSATLDKWQQANDPRLFKLIISPEFGDRMDLMKHTRWLLRQMEKDLTTKLEWVAVVHKNTDHAHVHVALRGIDERGQALQLPRDYVRAGIRARGEDLATQELGYRTQADAMEAERKEVSQMRWTSLDRALRKRLISSGMGQDVTAGSSGSMLSPLAAEREKKLVDRLNFLASIGLATKKGRDRWELKPDIEILLRTLQQSTDRQKMLAAHGTLPSDNRLPQRQVPLREFTWAEGRVLLHAEDERAGNRYLLLENVDGHIDLIHHTPSIEEARRQGALRVNHFVRLRKQFSNGTLTISVEDFGHAERLLKDESFLQQRAITLREQGASFVSAGWKGWLGNYQTAVDNYLMKQERDIGSKSTSPDLGR